MGCKLTVRPDVPTSPPPLLPPPPLRQPHKFALTRARALRCPAQATGPVRRVNVCPAPPPCTRTAAPAPPPHPLHMAAPGHGNAGNRHHHHHRLPAPPPPSPPAALPQNPYHRPTTSAFAPATRPVPGRLFPPPTFAVMTTPTDAASPPRAPPHTDSREGNLRARATQTQYPLQGP